MQIIKHKTNIDFIGKRRAALFISLGAEPGDPRRASRSSASTSASTSPAAPWSR